MSAATCVRSPPDRVPQPRPLQTIQVASGRDHVGAVAQRRRRTRTTETGTDPEIRMVFPSSSIPTACRVRRRNRPAPGHRHTTCRACGRIGDELLDDASDTAVAEPDAVAPTVLGDGGGVGEEIGGGVGKGRRRDRIEGARQEQGRQIRCHRCADDGAGLALLPGRAEVSSGSTGTAEPKPPSWSTNPPEVKGRRS